MPNLTARQMLSRLPVRMAEGGEARAFSDDEVQQFIQSTYAQFGGPGVEAHRAIANAMAQYGVGVNQVARVTGFSPREVEAEFMGQQAAAQQAAAPQIQPPSVQSQVQQAAQQAAAQQQVAAQQAQQQAAERDRFAGLSPDVSAGIGSSLSPTGITIDQTAISNAMAQYEAQQAAQAQVQQQQAAAQQAAAQRAQEAAAQQQVLPPPMPPTPAPTPAPSAAAQRVDELMAQEQAMAPVNTAEAALTPSQRALYEKASVTPGQGTPQQVYDYARGLQDIQAMQTLSVLSDPTDKTSFAPGLQADDALVYLKNKFGVTSAPPQPAAAIQPVPLPAPAPPQSQPQSAAEQLAQIKAVQAPAPVIQQAPTQAFSPPVQAQATEQPGTAAGVSAAYRKAMETGGQQTVGDYYANLRKDAEAYLANPNAPTGVDAYNLLVESGISTSDLRAAGVADAVLNKIFTVQAPIAQSQFVTPTGMTSAYERSPDLAFESQRLTALGQDGRAILDKQGRDYIANLQQDGIDAAERAQMLEYATERGYSFDDLIKAGVDPNVLFTQVAAVTPPPPPPTPTPPPTPPPTPTPTLPGTVTNPMDTRGSAATGSQSGVTTFLENYQAPTPFVAPTYTAPTVYGQLPTQPDIFSAGQTALDTAFRESAPRTAIPGLPGQFDYSPAAKLRPATGAGFTFTPPSVTTRPRSLLSPREVQAYGGLGPSKSQLFAQNRAAIDRNLRILLGSSPALRNTSTYNMLRNRVMSGEFGDAQRAFDPQTPEGQRFQAFLASLESSAPTGQAAATGTVATGTGTVADSTQAGGYAAARDPVSLNYGGYRMEEFAKGGYVKKSEGSAQDELARFAEGGPVDAELLRRQLENIDNTPSARTPERAPTPEQTESRAMLERLNAATPVERAVFESTGMEPGLDRAMMLPFAGSREEGNLQLAAPGFVYDAARAFVTPGMAARGQRVSDEDILNTAMNVMGGGVGASRVAGPRTAPDEMLLGMGVGSRGADDYRGSHRPPDRDYGASLDNLTALIPEDVYGPAGPRLYGIGDPEIDKEAFNALRAVRGKPDAEVTVYRAVPENVSTINEGDWVTTSRKYADLHGERTLDGNYKIIEQKAKAKDLFSEGYPYEFGYSPSDLAALTARAPTDTPEFKNFFGESKVVNESGQPLQVFHGTNVDIEQFATDIRSGRKRFIPGELGTWFGSTPKVANEFARGVSIPRERGVVYPVYLNIQNPKVYNSYEDFLNEVKGRRSANTVKTELRKQGYDGIQIKNSTTDFGGLRDDWVAFNPTQIKSAIGNEGTFDPANPVITKAKGGAVTKNNVERMRNDNRKYL